MRISTPAFLTVVVSLVLAVLAALSHYVTGSLPIIGSHSFGLLLLSYIVLMAGVLIPGL